MVLGARRSGTTREGKVLSTNSFGARFTVTIDGDAVTLTIADDRAVVSVTR